MNHGYLDLQELPTDVHPVDIAVVAAGSFAVVRTDDPMAPRLIGSDGYVDCVGCIAWIEKEDGTPEIYGFTHIDKDTDLESLHQMAEKMRGDDTSKKIFFDVFGGEEFSPTSADIEFQEEFSRIVKEIPNGELKQDLIANKNFKDEIIIDVATGKRYAGEHGNRYNNFDVSSFVHHHSWEPMLSEARDAIGRNERGYPLIEYKYAELRSKLVTDWKTRSVGRKAIDEIVRDYDFEEGVNGPSFEQVNAIPIRDLAVERLRREAEKDKGQERSR